MPIIRKSLLQLIFSGSYMKRWNDKLRPLVLVEVDKQAQKMIAAWVLMLINTKGQSREMATALADDIIKGGIYDYLYRLVITDIKPPVFYRIKENPAHYRQLSHWVFNQLKPRILPLGRDFLDQMQEYLLVPEHTSLSGRILQAAHLFASYSEFKLLQPVNKDDEDLKEIEHHFIDGLAKFNDIPGVRELTAPESAICRFVNLVGNLRFQTRWSQTPRIPETSVLGHMFIVACYSWFFSLEIGACPARMHNNFFTGLFHDLPELLTRDIISPVKRSAEEIGQLIKEYEDDEMNKKVFGPLRSAGLIDMEERLSYLLGRKIGSEFKACISDGTGPKEVSTGQLNDLYNHDDFDPKDGRLIKLSDNLAAFIEAYTAVRNGITSDQLQEALWRMRRHYQENPIQAGINVGALMADFD